MQPDRDFFKLTEGPIRHIQLDSCNCNYVQKHHFDNSQLLNHGVSPQEVP